jgi:nuclear pore complex protein Nup155
MTPWACAPGRDIFGGRTPNDKKGAAIAHMAVIPPRESSRLHLLVVTLDGRRVYLSMHGPAMPGSPQPAPRPSQLQVRPFFQE